MILLTQQLKKITFSDFNSGVNTEITNIKNKYDYSTTVSDGTLLIGSTTIIIILLLI